MSNLHLNWDGRQNNGVIFNATYQGALFTGIENRPALSFDFHSFQCSEVFEHPDYVINPDGTKRLMTAAEADEVKAVATDWIQPLGQEGNPTNEQTIETLTANIKAKRDAIQNGGVAVSDYWFHTDVDSKIKYLGLKDAGRDMLAAGGTVNDQIIKNNEPVVWETMAGDLVPMTVQLAIDIVAAVGDHEAAVHKASKIHLQGAKDSTTPDTYDYSTNWPAVYVPTQ